MLHARGENNDELFLGNPPSLVVNEAPSVVKTSEGTVEVLESRMGDIDEEADADADTGKDSGNESATTDSDSEDKKESFKEMSNALIGMNVS